MIGPVIGVLFDGFAYGMLLFLLSVGLSVTLGMMNFVNLAHCAFAMLGGYVTVTLMNDFKWPFFATLPFAFLAAAIVSVLFERVLYRRLYRASDLDQVLLTIGLAFVSVAVAAYFYGTIQQPVQMPAYLRGSVTIFGLTFGVYRLFLVGVSLVITLCWSPRSNTPASARRCAPRSTTSAWRAASASMSTARSPSPSRSAADLPASAARSRSRSSASIRPSPSPI
jgi:branched-chain amino acid transport system permease protein